MNCTVIIATLDRTESLRVVLDCLHRQTLAPFEIIVAASGDVTAVERAVEPFAARLPVRVMSCPEKSAAIQRNRAAAVAAGEIFAFLDDDIEFGDDLVARIISCFTSTGPVPPAALSPRIANLGGMTPSWPTRFYYRLQAGFADKDYGGRLFGPAINCLPVFPPDGPDLVPVDWLPSTCLFVRASCFRAQSFPAFSGYSFAEDVHLTARLARIAPLFFLREPSILHHSLPSEFKADRAGLTAGKLHNMARVAREVMGLTGWPLWWRWQFHRLFLTVVLLLRRPDGWSGDLRGVWSASL